MVKESDLPNHQWKPCTICKGGGLVWGNVQKKVNPIKCSHCSGTGYEPVEMENPIIKQYPCGKCDECEIELCAEPKCIYKHQVGVEFELCDNGHLLIYDALNDWSKCETNGYCGAEETSKFLPLRQKVSGDNSVLMVVKNE